MPSIAPQPDARRDRALDRTPQPWSVLAGVLIAVIAAIPFAPAITAGFIEYDDPALLMQYETWRGLGTENLRWMFTTTHMGHYQPLTWVSYAMNFLIWGLNPVAFHATNIGFHALNAVLVYMLARRLLGIAAGDRDGAPADFGPAVEIGAIAAALLFAIHPLRVESVAWVTERRDVLSTFFLLAAVLAYLRAFPARSVGPASPGWYAASVAFVLVSLLCKAWGMTAFVVLLALDWYPLRRLDGPAWRWPGAPSRSVVLQKLPYAVLGVGAAVMAGYAQASTPFTLLPVEKWGVAARACQATFGLMFYIQKLVLPTGLCVLYEVPLGQSLIQARFIAAAVFVAAGVGLAIALRRRFPAFTACALAYAVILAPVLGVNQSGPQLVADRYSYIANIPWAILGGGLVSRLMRSRAGRTAKVGAGIAGLALVVALGVLTWRQTQLWRDTERLLGHCLEVGWDGPITRVQYGHQLSRRGDPEAALVQFRRATEINPAYGDGWFNAANMLKDLGRLDEAERCYRTARQLMADSWRADTALGLMYLKSMNRPREAAQHFRAAIANVEAPGAKSFSARPYLMLAAALDELGDTAGARAMLEKAANYPETRKEALDILHDMDSDSGGR